MIKPVFNPKTFHLPPSAKDWRKIVSVMKAAFPLDFPVSVRWSKSPPPGTDPDWCALVEVYYADDGVVEKARIWVCAKLGRSCAVESLQHEWAHLMCEEEQPTDGEMPHDDRFWITHGKIYRVWQGET